MTGDSARGQKSVTFDRNHRSRCAGITGHVRSEIAVTLLRNHRSRSPGIIGHVGPEYAKSALKRYQGHVVAARKGWAETNRPLVTRFLRAMSEAVDWLYDPANRGRAFAIHENHMGDARPGAAATAHAILFDPVFGFPRNGELDIDGVEQVLTLREEYGRPKKARGDPLLYRDPSFLEDATLGVRP